MKRPLKGSVLRSVGFPPQSPTRLGGFSSTYLDRRSPAFLWGIFKRVPFDQSVFFPSSPFGLGGFSSTHFFLSCLASRPFLGRFFGFPPLSPVKVGRFFIDWSSWFSSSVFHWVWGVFHQLRKRAIFYHSLATYPTSTKASYHLHSQQSSRPRKKAIVMPWHVTKAFASMINRHLALLDRFTTPPYVTSSSTPTK